MAPAFDIIGMPAGETAAGMLMLRPWCAGVNPSPLAIISTEVMMTGMLAIFLLILMSLFVGVSAGIRYITFVVDRRRRDQRSGWP